MNRIEGVRDWIRDEAPMYDNVEVVYIDNLDPVIKLYDDQNQQIASIVSPFVITRLLAACIYF